MVASLVCVAGQLLAARMIDWNGGKRDFKVISNDTGQPCFGGTQPTTAWLTIHEHIPVTQVNWDRSDRTPAVLVAQENQKLSA